MVNRRPGRPPSTDSERWERLSPRDLALGTHLDVHGLRKQLLAAIEKSQTAIISRLSLVEAKIDKLGTGGNTAAEVAAVTAELREIREKLASAGNTPAVPPNT